MRYLSTLALTIVISLQALAQKHDYQWFMGHGGGSDSPLNDRFGISQLDFNNLNYPFVIERQEYDMDFFTSNGSMCDSSGNLQFYSNGVKIYGPNHKLMINGDKLVPSDGAGNRAPQAVLSLPYPQKPTQYVVLNTDYIFNSGNVIGWKLFDNTIDMLYPNGQVVKKLNLLVNDSITDGKLTATKHANGRDWWFIMPKELYSNGHYIGLLTPKGISLKLQEVGNVVSGGLGQAVFSPDGTKYIKANDPDLTLRPKVEIYDFDRCTGQLSNQRTLLIDHEGFGIGVSVSPDSRYLYVTRTRIAYQYDLTAPDIAATQKVVAEWDGFISYNYNNVFWLSQLAPDGRIYVSSLNNTYHLHQINFPNREGDACQFLQHSLKLPVLHLYDIPNHPNYRLGPLDGSPCDTLGLDNHPLANFRWEHEDSTELLRVTFTDLSAYEPESWQWDFGDGTTSMERYPVHDYPKEGVYNACLIVKNRFSSDTFCQKVYLGVSAQDNPDLQRRIEVWPNPFSDRLVLALSTPDLGRPLFRLFDATGRLVREERVEYGLNEIEVGDLAKGLYFWAVEQKGERIKSGKVVKM